MPSIIYVHNPLTVYPLGIYYQYMNTNYEALAAKRHNWHCIGSIGLYTGETTDQWTNGVENMADELPPELAQKIRKIANTAAETGGCEMVEDDREESLDQYDAWIREINDIVETFLDGSGFRPTGAARVARCSIR